MRPCTLFAVVGSRSSEVHDAGKMNYFAWASLKSGVTVIDTLHGDYTATQFKYDDVRIFTEFWHV